MREKRKRGFSVIEVLVAAALAIFIFLVINSLIGAGKKRSEKDEAAWAAADAARLAARIRNDLEALVDDPVSGNLIEVNDGKIEFRRATPSGEEDIVYEKEVNGDEIILKRNGKAIKNVNLTSFNSYVADEGEVVLVNIEFETKTKLGESFSFRVLVPYVMSMKIFDPSMMPVL